MNMSSILSERDSAILNCVFNPHLPLGEPDIAPPEELKDEEETTEEVNESKKLEIAAVRLAESGKLDKGLILINRAINIAPGRPSLYNNRAHIRQFLRNFGGAFDDVTTAINLSTNNHRKTLCQAYCQRGLLHRKADRTDLAREDFEMAAKMGNQFAKGQLVELNPYAALCNQMLRQVMDTMK